MTNFEKYVNTIINIRNQDSTDIAFAVDVKTGALGRCSEVGCDYCKFSCRHSGNSCCEVNIVRWLFEKYQKPVPKLTKAERGFCEILQTGYIARNKSGNLFVYNVPPRRTEIVWLASIWRELNCSFYPFITWESGKAWSIEDLLKLEVVDE